MTGSENNQTQKNNPLHGITLEMMLTQLVDFYGWEKLGNHIDINCFQYEPTIKSSLKFLRKTPWAREKVESFYLYYGNPPWRGKGIITLFTVPLTYIFRLSSLPINSARIS